MTSTVSHSPSAISLLKVPTVGVLALFLLASCSGKSDAERAQEVAVETLTAFYDGDIDAYIAHSSYGSELTPTQDSLMRLILRRYVDQIQQQGGLEAIEPLHAEQQDDTTVLVSYVLRMADGTSHACIKTMRLCDGEWKMEERMAK